MKKLTIIGSGPAGLTAAIYASRAGFEPVLIAGYQSGGQLMLTTEVENFPGFKDGVMGPELMMSMRAQAERFGTVIIDKDATGVDFSSPLVKKVMIDEEVIESEAVIIATGASAKWLEAKGEDQYRGRGVSTCATCDGAFFKNKIVAIVGGGDSAMEEANFLTRFASKVYLIHRRNEFRASKIMQERTKKNPKIEIIWNTVIDEVIGNGKSVTNAHITNIETSESSTILLDGIFVAIGNTPNTKFLNDQIELDEKGYIKSRGNDKNSIGESLDHISDLSETATNVPGVFFAGDVYDIRYKQAITAAASGCKASIDAEKYLEGIEN